VHSRGKDLEHKTTLGEARFDEALDAAGCPICRHVRASEERFIWQVLYEFGSDQGMRAQLDRTLGLCTRHAHLLVAVVEERELVDGASVAHIYESIVRKYLKSCRAVDASSQRAVRALGDLDIHECPLCTHRDGAESRAVDSLLGLLHSTAGAQRYASSDGLCNRHLRVCLERAGDAELRKRLFDDHVERLERLIANLDELLRKQRYDVDEDIAPSEAVSWREAIWRLTGMRYDGPLIHRNLR
jgi:hypothetical protein